MKRILCLCDRPLGLRCLDFLVEKGGFVCAVVSRPDGEGNWWGKSVFRAYCESRGLAWYDSSLPLSSVVRQSRPDIVLSLLFPQMVDKDIVSRFLSFNLHCAPLPEYKGFNATLWAILNGEKTFGATIHRMADRPDEGEIIAKGNFEIPENATNIELYKMAHEDGYRLFCETLESIITGCYKATPQTAKGRFYGKQDVPSREVDLRWSIEKISTYARAFYFPPFEPAYSILNGLKIRLMPGA